MRLRRVDDANLWSGVYRCPHEWKNLGKPDQYRDDDEHKVPTLVVTLRLRYWSLPLTFSVGGHLLAKPGCTIGLGPVYFSWSRM